MLFGAAQQPNLTDWRSEKNGISTTKTNEYSEAEMEKDPFFDPIFLEHDEWEQEVNKIIQFWFNS